MVFSPATQFHVPSLRYLRKAFFAALAGLGALLTAAVLNGAPSAAASDGPKSDISVDELMKTGELPENALGKDDAPNTIVEYSSLTCPHCAEFHKDMLPKLKEKYIATGKARYILREFPLDNVAAAGFILARCVDKEKYFDFIDLLYAHQDEWAFTANPLADLPKFAKQVGFTEDRFGQCLADEKILKHIEWVRERGHKLFGISGTPTFFVNGKPIKGPNTMEMFDEFIEGKK